MYNRATAAYEKHQIAPRITVKGKEVHVNGVRIPTSATSFRRQQIYWRHQDQSAFSYGNIHFHPHGQAFHGMYATGASPSTAALVAVQGAVPTSTYTTTISKKPSYDPEEKKCSVEEGDDDAFTSGPEVEIGYTWEGSADGIPKQIFKVGGEDLHSEMTMDSANHFIIGEDFVTSYYADKNASFPVAGEFTMAADSKSFSGSITLKQDGENVANFCWNGQSTNGNDDSEPVADVSSLPQPLMLASEPLSTTDSDSTDSAEELSTLDLFTLCHASDQMQTDCQNMLMEVMKYVIGAPDQHPDWLENFLGARRPTLSQEVQEVSELPDSLDFYTNFAIPYIGLGIYQNKGEGIPDISVLEGRTMNYYFQNGLAKEPGYNVQTNALYLQAFLENEPRLQLYIDDQENQKAKGNGDYYWAVKLHDAVLDDDNINTMVSSVIQNQGDVHQQLRDYGSVLNILQPSGELAQDAYTQLLTAVFGRVSETMNADDIKDTIYPWVNDFIQEWVDKYDEGEPPETDPEAHQAWEVSEAFKEAAEFAGNLANLADQISDLIVAERVGNSMYDRSYGVGNKIASLYEGRMSDTKLKAMKRGVITSVHVAAVYTTIQAFSQWETVPSEQKVALVASSVQLGAEILIDMPEVINDAVSIFRAVRNVFCSSSRLQSLAQRIADTELMTTIAGKLRGFFTAAGDFLAPVGDILTTMFDTLSVVVNYIAPIVTLIVVVANIIMLANESNPAVQDTILIVIQSFAGVMEAAFLAAGLVVEELLCFAGPFAILAVVAAIVQFFVDLFVKPDPDPSPSETFYSDVLKDYIEQLTPPPEDFDPDGEISSSSSN